MSNAPLCKLWRECDGWHLWLPIRCAETPRSRLWWEWRSPPPLGLARTSPLVGGRGLRLEVLLVLFSLLRLLLLLSLLLLLLLLRRRGMRPLALAPTRTSSSTATSGGRGSSTRVTRTLLRSRLGRSSRRRRTRNGNLRDSRFLPSLRLLLSLG